MFNLANSTAGKTPDAQELTVKIWLLPPDEVCTIALGDDAIVDRLELLQIIYLSNRLLYFTRMCIELRL